MYVNQDDTKALDFVTLYQLEQSSMLCEESEL